jgi:hypothetical protein
MLKFPFVSQVSYLFLLFYMLLLDYIHVGNQYLARRLIFSQLVPRVYSRLLDRGGGSRYFNFSNIVGVKVKNTL